MSKNIDQIYIANPITSNASTDLMYFGQSPYTTGDDAAMTFANFSAQFSPSGSGKVNSGTAQQVGYYAASGSTISGFTVSNTSALTCNGSGNLASLSYTDTATNSTLVSRNAAGNFGANNYYGRLLSITGTTSLVVSSPRNIIFTGTSGTPTLTLPAGTSLQNGWIYYISNQGSVNLTITTDRGGASFIMLPFTTAQLTLIDNSTLDGNWINDWFTPEDMLDGQIFIGSSSNGPQAATLTAGTGITITNSSNAITIASSAGGGVNPGTAQQVGYYASNGSTISGLTVSNTSALTANGSGNLTSLAYTASSTASTLAFRDSNANIGFNNFFGGTTSNSASGTVTLTVASSRTQIFSGGSGTATLVLPNATTLSNGWTYYINNNASGNITVQQNGGATLCIMPPSSYVQLFLISNSTSAGQWDFRWLVPASMTDGQVLIGSSTNGPQASTLTAGAGITITNASNAITIASTSAQFWSLNTNATITAVVNNGYVVNNGTVNVILPSTFSEGELIGVQGSNSNWSVSIAGGTNVQSFGSTYTSSISSSVTGYDSIILIGTVANTTWSILSMSAIGFTAT